MKKLRFAIILILLISLMISCIPSLFTVNPKTIVKNELGLDVGNGKVISSMDTHGGFLGDGCTLILISLEDESVLEEIKRDSSWKKLPLDETARVLIYDHLAGMDDMAIIPEVKNGFYIMIDRHTDKDTPILDRYSFNFTVGLYDTDSDILYFAKMDT